MPRPIVTGPGQATALAAAGSWIAAASACDVRAVAVGGKPRLLKRFGFCREDRFDSGVIGLWLGHRTIVEEVIISPSPHGESYQLWSGPLPGGPLHQIGSDWGWTDSDEPPTYGCDWSIAAGGGVVALVRVPNNLGEGQACLGAKTSRIVLVGAVNRTVTLAGAWSVLATDGKRIALAALDANGGPTGTLAMIGVNGKRLGAPNFTAADVRTAFQGWLTPKGLVLDSKRGLVGPGSRLLVRRGYSAETIGEGRLLYLRGRTIRVRRLRGGPDRRLLKLPTGEAELAAGSFGLAVMTGTIGERTAVYRISWHTIDRTLTR